MGVVAKLTAKGQITLPKEVRDRHGLKAGDRVEFIEQNGMTWMKPRNVRAIDLAGVLGPPPKGPKTLEEIEEGIAQAAAESGTRGLK
jgi:AbrB family looped-hinge helix DNA binding protein